jgi:hypothetical protein
MQVPTVRGGRRVGNSTSLLSWFRPEPPQAWQAPASLYWPVSGSTYRVRPAPPQLEQFADMLNLVMEIS